MGLIDQAIKYIPVANSQPKSDLFDFTVISACYLSKYKSKTNYVYKHYEDSLTSLTIYCNHRLPQGPMI